MRRLLTGFIAAMVAVPLLPAPGPGAATPGKNGPVAYSAFIDGNFDNFVSNPDGSHAHNVTKTDGVDEFDPAFSPNGKALAYAEALQGSPSDIVVASSTGAGARPLTATADIAESAPAFSPDGASIAFVARTPTGTSDVWVAPLEAPSTPVQITMSGNVADGGITWKPDGSAIVFAQTRVGLGFAIDLYQVPAAGGEATRLTEVEDGLEATDPDFSPDGTRIAYLLRNGIFSRTTHVMNADASGDLVLDEREGHLHSALAWSPNGKRILVFDSTRRGQAIVTYDPSGGGRKLVRSENAPGLAWGACAGTCETSGKQPSTTYLYGAEALGKNTVVDFEVVPRHAGRKALVILQRRVGGTWKEKGRYLIPLSRFGLTSSELPMKLAAGRCRAVVRFRGDADHEASAARRKFSCR